MEVKYISLETADQFICDVCERPGCPILWGGDCDRIDRLNKIPAADVRPVVRGHYVGEYDGYADGNPVYDMWYCSECGCCFEDWDEKPSYNFCPNCGADMREVKADG